MFIGMVLYLFHVCCDKLCILTYLVVKMARCSRLVGFTSSLLAAMLSYIFTHSGLFWELTISVEAAVA